MPKAQFGGRIHVVQTDYTAKRAVDYLLRCPLLGIDSETRPTFKRGKENKVALLQVSSDTNCFLFRLNLMGLTPAIVRLLEDTTVTKVGLSLKDDFHMLHKRAGFEQHACVELQDYVAKFGIREKSLRKIHGILFGTKISKAQQLSNWEAPTLNTAQQLYAATDAWACINIYRKLQELEQTGDYILIDEPPAEEHEQQP